MHHVAHSAHVRVAAGWPNWVRSSATNARSDSADAPHRSLALERAETAIPVVVSRHAGLAADALPAGGGQVLAVAVTQREVGEHVEQAAASQTAAIDVEEVEHEARRQPFGERGARAAVPRDVGRGQVVLDEPGVRTLSRPEHGDPFERRA